MPRVLVTFLFGGVAGLVSGQAYGYVSKRNLNKENSKYDIQKKLTTQWSKPYEPTYWDWNWDGREKAYQDQKKAEKHEKEMLKSNSDHNSNIKGTDVAHKRDINNNYIANTRTKNKPLKLANATRNILLIRHGQYNTAGEKDVDHTLTKNGIEQATSTGKHLKKTDLPFSKLIVSTMTRAQETANLVEAQLTNLPFTRSATHLLREGAPFPPEPPIHTWRPDDKFLDEGVRIEEAFKTFFHRADVHQTEDSYEIVVCHANVIRYIVCRALQMPPEAWLRMSLQHASITWLSIRPSGRVTLRSLGDGGHIPLPLKTFS